MRYTTRVSETGSEYVLLIWKICRTTSIGRPGCVWKNKTGFWSVIVPVVLRICGLCYI